MEMFMIVPPLNPRDKPADEIMLGMGYPTLAPTAGEAWTRHTRNDPSKVQAWFDRGYRLRRVEIELKAEVPFTPSPESEEA